MNRCGEGNTFWHERRGTVVKRQAVFPLFAPILDQKIETKYLVYLDIWERHITSIEEDRIREVALGGPDTATRSKVVWQVKTTDTLPDKTAPINLPQDPTEWRACVKKIWPDWVKKWQPTNCGQLKAKSKKDAKDETACITSPESRYRGKENQLYRVEIHKGGTVEQGATFKWSRENGSVVFPIRESQGKTITLEHLGRDSRFGLKEGDWVEIVDDDYIFQNRAEKLLQIEFVDRVNLQVTLSEEPKCNVDLEKHPLLQRWDYK